jgi:hypothetical protein
MWIWPEEKTRRVGHLQYIIAADIVYVPPFGSNLLSVRVVIKTDDESGRLRVQVKEND